MSGRSRGDFRPLTAELDAWSSQPTAELLAESISRLKIATSSHAAGGEPLSKALTCAGETNLHQPRFPHIAARDHGVDIWALGVVHWEMLTARRLFRCSLRSVVPSAALTR